MQTRNPHADFITQSANSEDGHGTTLDAALSYYARGWAPINLPYGSKKPNRNGWQNERLTEPDIRQRFNGTPQNVGVLLGEPSGNLVDIDLDIPEAASLAPHFLTPTGATFGRAGNPRSHWLYCADPLVETVKWADPTVEKEAMILELRSTGGQTVFPHSRHGESGEHYRWFDAGSPAQIDGRELQDQAGRLAAAALLARHWPGQGARHGYALAVAGGLLRAGGRWTEEAVSEYIGLIATCAGDEETRDRMRTVADTAKAIRTNQRATGWPTAAEIVDQRIIDKVRAWLNVRADESGGASFRISDAEDTEREATLPATPSWPEPPDRAAYYGLAGDVVRALDPATEADPVGVLMTFLAAVGNIVGSGPHWTVSGRDHGLRIFPVLVGPTSKARKGTSWGIVKAVLDIAAPEWLHANVASGLSSGEGLIWAVRDEIVKTEPIKDKGKIVDYQEVIVDPGVDDKRMLVIEEEFASTLKVMGREGSTLSAVIRQAWDDGELRTLTKNTPARATGAHITILGHITQHELTRYLDNTEAANGFANRFLWVCVRRSKPLPDGGDIDWRAVAELGQQLRSVLDASQKIGLIQRDTEAAEMWRAVYGPLSEGGIGLLGAVLSRAEAQVMRLACLYAVLDRSHTIRREHLEAALAVWDYLDASARYIFGEALGDPIADTIMTALRAGELTRSDIRDLFGRNQSASRINQALGLLLSAGKVRRSRRETGGRPVEVWHAV